MYTFLRRGRMGNFGSLAVATFFLALHIFSVIFLNASFLSTFGNTDTVSALYILGAGAGIIALIIAPYLLRILGVVSFTVILGAVEILTVIALGVSNNLFTASIFFILYWITTILLLYCLDIFIEHSMRGEKHTSVVRGSILTIANAALFIFPVVGGIMITEAGYESAYTLGAVALIPFVAIIMVTFRTFIDPPYPSISLPRGVRKILGNVHMRSIFILHLLLRIFFSATVIYLPLYLLGLGFSWPEVGIILSIMLIPLVLFEFPIGELGSDTDESTLFSIGFLILGVGTALLGIVTENHIALIALILFVAHSGAAVIEVVSESAFFKRVQGDDVDLISLFRVLRPLGYILGPVIATLTIPYIGFTGFFCVVALLLFGGVVVAFRLKEK